ncbi:MAG: glycosyltransferase family 1 protein [Gemmataceae bacterium]|nr:glycosyltransferase family 1 protein [Gemmataceae bacterium]
MRLLLATDAWLPQVNGVVRTLSTTVRELQRFGHAVRVVHPALFPNVSSIVYPEIRLALPSMRRVAAIVRGFAPDAIHMATEGPIGNQVRRYCVVHALRFTTSYHTRFPEYLNAYLGLPLSWGHAALRWFHRPAEAVMVSTPTLEQELRTYGFRNRIVRWSRGVDMDLFHPRERAFPEAHRPIAMYVGRLSREKNLDAFFALKGQGTRYVVGDGPLRRELERRHRDVVFLGSLSGEALATAYANADVVVFPSRTDTFGLVILEALASGVPVAAYPVPGPSDILEPPQTGALHEDLSIAVELALRFGDAQACAALARRYDWGRTTRQFAGNLVAVRCTRDAVCPASGGR